MMHKQVGILRRLPATRRPGAADHTVLERAQNFKLAEQGYACKAPEGGYVRSDAGHLALIQHDRKLAVEMRDLLHTLLSGSAPDACDHRVANLVEAGLADLDGGCVRLNRDGEWMAQRSLEDYVQLWESRPNVLQIFRAIDAGRVTLDEAQALLAAERARRHPTFLRRLLDLVRPGRARPASSPWFD